MIPTGTGRFYRTGVAAKELGVSNEHIRALCEARLIRAEQIESGHWRIEASEVARLKREGVPPIPQPLPGQVEHSGGPQLGAPHRPAPAKNILLSDPSTGAIDSAESVLTAEHKVKRLRFQVEAEEEQEKLDQLLARKDKSKEDERQAARQSELDRAHRAWTEQWAQTALRTMPGWAPPEARSDVHAAVVAKLHELTPDSPTYLVQQLITSEAARALRPWQHNHRVEEILKDCIRRLPYDLKYTEAYAQWRSGLVASGRELAHTLGPSVPDKDIEDAISPLFRTAIAGYEYIQLRATIVEAARVEVARQLPSDERPAVLECLNKAIQPLPIGTDEKTLKAACAAAVAPFKAQIAQAEERKRREAAAAQDREMREALIRSMKLPWSATTSDERAKVEQGVRAQFARLPQGSARAVLEKVCADAVASFVAKLEDQKRRKSLVETGLNDLASYLSKLRAAGQITAEAVSLMYELSTMKIRPRLEQKVNEDDRFQDPRYIRRWVQAVVDKKLGI